MKRTLLILFVLLPFLSMAQVDTISTIAGNGLMGDLGDGAAATSARIYGGFGCIVDNAGNFYFSERGYHKVRKVNPSGIISTIAGNGIAGFSGDGGPATSAQINNPLQVAVDSFGNIFIADLNNNRIRKIDVITGAIITVAGNGSIGFSGDGGPATNASLNGPTGICIDPFGNLYISEISNNRIRKVNSMGIITTYAGTGTAGYSGDGGPATSAEIASLECICSDQFGNIYIACGENIRKIDATGGIITNVAGNGISGYSGDGGSATSAELAEPFDVTVDVDGNVFIADNHNNRVRKVDAAGIISTIAGDGVAGYTGDNIPASIAEMYWPQGITVDNCGNLYIADIFNFRIRKVIHIPTPITLTNAITTLIPTICTGTFATFTAASTISSGAVAYQWYVNGMPIAGATSSSYTYTPADADSIRCIATATNPCTSAVTSSNTIIMSVIPITTPTITVAAPAAAPVGSIVTVNATVSGAGTGYTLHWYNNAVLFSTTATLTTTYTKPPGTDHITATIVPGEGCYDSTTSAEWLVTASTTGVGEGVIVSLPNEERQVLRTYPNPVKNVLCVANVSTQATYKILSAVGDVLLEGMLEQGNNSIDLNSLSTGVYMLKISSPGQQFSNFQIVKFSN